MVSNEKGSALISVILVVLVLTMVGVASLFYMTTEDRISNIGRLEKAAFYAAETGLRAAERSMTAQYANDPDICKTLLAYPGTSDNTFDVPNGGGVHPTAVVFTDPGIPAHLDPANSNINIPATEMRSMAVPGNTEGYAVAYDIYVRNDDGETSPTLDFNSRVSVVAVGIVTTADGRVIRKVLEEMLGPIVAAGSPGDQTGGNSGGTGGINI